MASQGLGLIIASQGLYLLFSWRKFTEGLWSTKGVITSVIEEPGWRSHTSNILFLAKDIGDRERGAYILFQHRSPIVHSLASTSNIETLVPPANMEAEIRWEGTVCSRIHHNHSKLCRESCDDNSSTCVKRDWQSNYSPEPRSATLLPDWWQCERPWGVSADPIKSKD